MSRYTFCSDSLVDESVDKVLNKVTECVMRILSDKLHTLLLVGSFGRGEGSVIKVNDGFELVNDLDLVAFVNGSTYNVKKKYGLVLNASLENLRSEIQGLKSIDVEIISKNRYRIYQPNTVAYYEMAESNRILYGKSDISKMLPKINPKKLPLYEGVNYFQNRASGLLLPAIYYYNSILSDTWFQRNFLIECQKACFAIGDAFLISQNMYHYSYKERLNRIKNICDNASESEKKQYDKIYQPYAWALKQKMQPNFQWTNVSEMMNKWNCIKNSMKEYFLEYESSRLGCYFCTWIAYSEYIKKRGNKEPLYRQFKRYVKCVFNNYKYNQLAIIPMLLFGIEDCYSIDKDYLIMAEKLIGFECKPNQSDTCRWIKVAKKYLMDYHAGGAVHQAFSS